MQECDCQLPRRTILCIAWTILWLVLLCVGDPGVNLHCANTNAREVMITSSAFIAPYVANAGLSWVRTPAAPRACASSLPLHPLGRL